jgi:hypothetical protein
VDQIRNGMSGADLGTHGWRKPWSDDAGGACLEAMRLPDGRVALRQSTDPGGPALICNRREIESFILGTKAGDADFLLQQ